MKVIITGAGGFVGGYLMKDALKTGADVIALTRNAEKLRSKIGKLPSVQIFEYDTQSEALPQEFLEAASGADRAYHLAASKRYFGNAPELKRDNVEFTEKLYSSLSEVGLKEFVFTSTIDVYGSNKGNYSLATEETIPRPISGYGLSKLEAERRLIELSSLYGSRCLILRLGNLYGIGSKLLAVEMAQALLEGPKNPLIRYYSEIMNALVQPSSVKDVSRAVFHAPESDYTSGRVINLCGEEPIPVKKIMKIVSESMRIEFRGKVSDEKTKSAFNKRIEYMLSKKKVDRTTYLGLGNWIMSNLKAKKILNYAENVNIEEGILEVINWAKSTRLL